MALLCGENGQLKATKGTKEVVNLKELKRKLLKKFSMNNHCQRELGILVINWCTPKLLVRFNYEFKCENSGRIRSWARSLARNTLGVKGMLELRDAD